MNIFVFRAKHFLLLILVLLAGFIGFFSAGSVAVFKSGSRSLPVYSVSRDDNKASITFNCAWGDEDIDKILKTLSKYEAKATFFIVGEWAEKYPESLKKIFESGHEIAAHSYNHKDYAKLTASEIKEDIQKNDEAICTVTGSAPALYRVPSGSYNNNAIDTLESCGKTAIQWSCDSIDYNDADAESIYNRSIKLEPGGILLMHAGTTNTAVALNRILDNLTGRLTLVPVGELLYKDNFTIDATGKMLKNGD